MNSTAYNKALRYSAAIVAVVVAAVIACGFLAQSAFAKETLDAPMNVSDDITRVHVNKLDADTHEYVQGASMAIIEKETGKVVDEWVTGSGAHENEKNLDVDKVYILREVSAPDGFEKVQDTEFKVNATEGSGVTILSGPGELTESYKINLYDKKTATENVTTVTQQRNTTTTENSSSTSKTTAPKTGDETPINLVAAIVVIAIIAIGVLEIPKRRIKEQ